MNLRISACIVAFAALPSAALAQPYSRDASGPHHEPQYQDQTQSYAARHGGGQCHAWCPQDYSPCDPANFKIADGRCKTGGRPGGS